MSNLSSALLACFKQSLAAKEEVIMSNFKPLNLISDNLSSKFQQFPPIIYCGVSAANLYLFYNKSCHFVLYVHNASLPCGHSATVHSGSCFAYNLHCLDPDFFGASFCVGLPRYNWGVIHGREGLLQVNSDREC